MASLGGNLWRRVQVQPNRHLSVQNRRRGNFAKSVAGFVATPFPEKPEPPIDPVALDDGNFATVLTINDRMCRWPIGDPGNQDFHFCGHKPRAGSPYCAAHCSVAYDPVSESRRQRAPGPLW
jgi:hypothetical protein